MQRLTVSLGSRALALRKEARASGVFFWRRRQYPIRRLASLLAGSRVIDRLRASSARRRSLSWRAALPRHIQIEAWLGLTWEAVSKVSRASRARLVLR